MSDKQSILQELKASIASIEAQGSALQKKNPTSDHTYNAELPRDTTHAQHLDNLAISSYSYSDSANPEEASDFTDAFNKIVRLVNHREHSMASLRKRLRQASFNDETIEKALAKAQELGLVDDIRFGNILVRSRICQGRGCQGIERELLQEGIQPDEIETFLEYRDEVAPQNEVTQALEILQKHPPKAKNIYESAYRKLRQKGYDNSTAHEAIRLWKASLS